MEIKIYTLTSTRDLNNIKYVGKTKQAIKRRLSQHLSAAKKSKNECYIKNHNYNWINKELSEGYDIIITELDSMIFEENEDWEWLEQYWISQIKSWGFKINNLTSGGDGNKNQIFTEESIKKRADKIRGIPRDEETRNKISKGLKGKPKTEQHINNTREGIIALQGKKIKQYSLYGEFIQEWRCATDASRLNNWKNPSNINKSAKNSINGISSPTYGYYWKYSDDTSKLIYDKTKYVCQLDLHGNFIREWFNLNTISKELNLAISSLLRCCTHKCKKVGNFIFCYYPEYISGEYKQYLLTQEEINKGRKIVQKTIDGIIIKEFNSCTEAAKNLHFSKEHILDCCRGERTSVHNFIFEYI